MDHTIKVETQGAIGIEDELQAADISVADIVIPIIDVKIKGGERFTSRRIVRAKIEIVIKSPAQFLEEVEKSPRNG